MTLVPITLKTCIGLDVGLSIQYNTASYSILPYCTKYCPIIIETCNEWLRKQNCCFLVIKSNIKRTWWQFLWL
jgi:hypothetical protein